MYHLPHGKALMIPSSLLQMMIIYMQLAAVIQLIDAAYQMV